HRYRTIAISELFGYFVGYFGVAIALALLGAGVFSLVAAGIAQPTIVALLQRHSAGIARTGPQSPARDLGPFLRFGGGVSLIGFVSFWGLQVDTLGVGRSIGAAAL